MSKINKCVHPPGCAFFLYTMTKPKLLKVFRPASGIWMDADGEILADFLANRGIVVDDRTQFARLYDYDLNECIWYRAYSSQKITITIWDITPL